MSPLFVVLFIVGLVALIAASIVFSILHEKKHREAIQVFASELGLEYGEQLSSKDGNAFGSFQLSQRGRRHATSNAIVADSGVLRMVIFDYQFTTGSGKQTKTHRQTVVMAHSNASLQTPAFTISPESFLSRIGDFFGFKDIDFEDDQEFSDAFLLHGEEEEAIRSFFDPVRRKKFFDFRDVTIEARGDSFVFYKPNTRSKADEYRPLMERAFTIYTLLSSSE